MGSDVAWGWNILDPVRKRHTEDDSRPGPEAQAGSQ